MTINFHGLMCDHGIDITTRCLDCELAVEFALDHPTIVMERESIEEYWARYSDLFQPTGSK
jgi:hypothetical protein